MTLTQPRPYSDEWRTGPTEPLPTRFGTVELSLLGWGIRISQGDNEPLRVNGGLVKLGWWDYTEQDGEWVLGESFWADKPGGASASRSQIDKIKVVLPPLVKQWAKDNAAEVERRWRAYVSDRARQCEESIRELEEALIDYRERLQRIEAGDLSVSPYLNRGKGIDR